MTSDPGVATAMLDAVDRKILHAIRFNPRSPYALIADVIGSSEQTVARRYRRMEAAGVVRVIGLVRPQLAGFERWLLRIQSRPASASNLAQALARRADVSWVGIYGGGSEVTCSTRTRWDVDNHELILQRLPRTAEVHSLQAHLMLHHFEAERDWHGFDDKLTEAQFERLCPPPGRADGSARIEDDDAPLLAALARNGRATLTELAARTDWTVARVGRRIDQLVTARAIEFDVDLASERLGFGSMASLWMTVPPGQLDQVGRALIEHEEVVFCAAIGGNANLTASVVCRNSVELYRYVSTRIGALPGIAALEISPLLRRIKQAGSMVTASGIGP